MTVSVDTPYAAKQELDLRLKHPRGGGARYMSRALALVGGGLEQIVATKVDAQTATGRLSDHRSHSRRRP